MRNPSKLQRGLFIASMGFLLVGVAFTILSWPPAALFTWVGICSSLVFYVWFTRSAGSKGRSAYVRHLAYGSFLTAQGLKVSGSSASVYFMLLTLVAFLIWVLWSVLSDLPDAGN